MPRPRVRAVFELGGYWVSTIPGRKCLYAFWSDPRDGGTRRQSLGTEDLREAKIKLAEMALQRSPATNKTPLPIVLENYFLERTDLLPSKKAARTAGRIILESLGENARVGDVTEAWQKDFARERAELGNSLGYIERTFSVLGAALRHAKLTVPLIVSESHMRDIWKITAKAPRKAFVPTDHQLATILRKAHAGRPCALVADINGHGLPAGGCA
jgi:hypothetical protein